MEVHKQKKYVDIIFKISLVLKAFNAIIEILAGIAAAFLTQEFLVNVVTRLTQSELFQDPDDSFAHFLLNSAQHFSSSDKFFILFYLLSHGLVKLALVLGLYMKKRWAYTYSFIIFGLFIIYQMYHYFFVGHSVWYLFLTVLDVFILWIIWREYKFVKETLK
jgi:uncharacterized membrane protein